MHEFEFITWIRNLLQHKGRRKSINVGIGDDMAVVDFHGKKLLIGSDMTIENVHFRFPEISPESVGHKAVGRCLSDLAAMGGEPIGAIVSLARPVSMSDSVLKKVYRGLIRTAEKFHCPIIGGDTSSGKNELVLDVCLLGKCEKNLPILRSGARCGDTIYVTGKLGGSILGKHVSFVPRIRESHWLVRHIPVHSMIDISDGLSGDLGHILEESRIGAELDETLLQNVISSAARKLSKTSGKTPLEHTLNDGEDFELLLTSSVTVEKLPKLPEWLKLYPIGQICKGDKIILRRADGSVMKLTSKGFRHF
jgi:thiamine-monophosphate kinase